MLTSAQRNAMTNGRILYQFNHNYPTAAHHKTTIAKYTIK